MLERRDFVRKCAGMGFAGTLLPGVLWAQAQAASAKKITKEMIESAAAIADVPISDEYKEMMLENLNDQASGYEEIYKLHMPNSVAPALIFDPVTSSTKFETEKRPMRMSAAKLPDEYLQFGKAGLRPNYEILAFASVRQLAELVRTRKVSSQALTQMYLARLKKYDPVLKCVVTLTEERALAQAKKADEEITAGRYRGPLHGLPWGAKDLLATKGYKTTWGAGGFENQMIDEDATVVQRLDKAGAVLVAKLTLGALAQGDVWFGGITRNPWNTKRVLLRRRQRDLWRSALGRRRWDRFRRHRRVAGARDCGRHLGWCRARVRWRFPGAWTSWGRFAGRWRTARWCSKRFMGGTAKTRRCSWRRSIGMRISIARRCVWAM